MATLTPETGEGVAGANSYASTQEADDYHELRGNAAWASATAAQKTAGLVQATDYLTAHYRPVLPSLTATQGLPWPTVDGLPAPVKAATITLALYALAGPISGPVERGIKSTKESLDGVVSEEITYDDVAPADRYPVIASMLYGIATTDVGGRLVVGRLTR